jgi:hypothetical protein
MFNSKLLAMATPITITAGTIIFLLNHGTVVLSGNLTIYHLLLFFLHYLLIYIVFAYGYHKSYDTF